jgi:hypothetical protein
MCFGWIAKLVIILVRRAMLDAMLIRKYANIEVRHGPTTNIHAQSVKHAKRDLTDNVFLLMPQTLIVNLLPYICKRFARVCFNSCSRRSISLLSSSRDKRAVSSVDGLSPVGVA